MQIQIHCKQIPVHTQKWERACSCLLSELATSDRLHYPSTNIFSYSGCSSSQQHEKFECTKQTWQIASSLPKRSKTRSRTIPDIISLWTAQKKTSKKQAFQFWARFTQQCQSLCATNLLKTVEVIDLGIERQVQHFTAQITNERVIIDEEITQRATNEWRRIHSHTWVQKNRKNKIKRTNYEIRPKDPCLKTTSAQTEPSDSSLTVACNATKEEHNLETSANCHARWNKVGTCAQAQNKRHRYASVVAELTDTTMTTLLILLQKSIAGKRWGDKTKILKAHHSKKKQFVTGQMTSRRACNTLLDNDEAEKKSYICLSKAHGSYADTENSEKER